MNTSIESALHIELTALQMYKKKTARSMEKKFEFKKIEAHRLGVNLASEIELGRLHPNSM